MVPNFVWRVGLAKTGGKQAILKRADHRFIERIEFVSHNGRTSFPQLRALGAYHECAERSKSLSKNIVEKFLQLRMPRLVHIALWLGRIQDPRRGGGQDPCGFQGVLPAELAARVGAAQHRCERGSPGSGRHLGPQHLPSDERGVGQVPGPHRSYRFPRGGPPGATGPVRVSHLWRHTGPGRCGRCLPASDIPGPRRRFYAACFGAEPPSRRF